MRAPRRTLVLMCASLLGGTAPACRSRAAEEEFLATRVPVARLDSVLRAADSVRLPLADARALLGVVAEPGLEARLPRDTMTMAEIVAWARVEHARYEHSGAEARAREERVRRQLDSLVTVTVVNKGYLPKAPEEGRDDDYISLTFAYTNTGTRAIRAFQGDVSFLDAFGDTVYSAHLKVEVSLAPGQSRRESGRIIRYDPSRSEHQRLRNTPLSKLRITWVPSDVVFADGSRVGLTEDGDGP